MQTRTYSSLFSLIEGLCGLTFASNEVSRVNALINRRAKLAYEASLYWPRFLVVGEARAASSGVIPFTEGILDPIDTFLRIHRTEPFAVGSAQDFDYILTSGGAKLIDGSLDTASAYVSYRKQNEDTYGDGTGGTVSDIPDEWFDYIAHGVAADWLRSEGQQEKAIVADQEAKDILDEQLWKISTSSVMDLVGTRILTTANMQARDNLYYQD